MSLEEYRIHVHSVLQRPLENCLYVMAEKCEFHSSLISFLGYILAGGQTPWRYGRKKKSPTPTSLNHLQRFLGFANFYHHFIRNYSQVATALTHLNSTKIPFVWSPEVEAALSNRNNSSPLYPFLSTQISWRWTPPIQVLRLCSLSSLGLKVSCSLVLFSLTD